MRPTARFTSRSILLLGARRFPARRKSPLPSKVTVEIVDRIPRRVVDAQGNAGDNTNFVVVGDEKKVLAAFEAAGWVKVDRGKEDAIIHGLLTVLNKQAYVELPMSELTLFGRVQDYGLAHAEPIAVVMQRHHLRLWKAPFKVDDQELWVGAATHDIGFDRDQRNNGVTHKIDPDVDLEREFVKAEPGRHRPGRGPVVCGAVAAVEGSSHGHGRDVSFRWPDAGDSTGAVAPP